MRYSKTKSTDTFKFNYIYKQIVFNCFILNINEILKLKYYSFPLSGVVFTDADNNSRTGGRTSKGNLSMDRRTDHQMCDLSIVQLCFKFF